MEGREVNQDRRAAEASGVDADMLGMFRASVQGLNDAMEKARQPIKIDGRSLKEFLNDVCERAVERQHVIDKGPELFESVLAVDQIMSRQSPHALGVGSSREMFLDRVMEDWGLADLETDSIDPCVISVSWCFGRPAVAVVCGEQWATTRITGWSVEDVLLLVESVREVAEDIKIVIENNAPGKKAAFLDEVFEALVSIGAFDVGRVGPDWLGNACGYSGADKAEAIGAIEAELLRICPWVEFSRTYRDSEARVVLLAARMSTQ